MPRRDDSAVPARGRILAIDPGERRIGVAGADLGLRVAIPLTTIEGGPDAVEAVARLVDEEDARALVVGLPLSLSGALGQQVPAGGGQHDHQPALQGLAHGLAVALAHLEGAVQERPVQVQGDQTDHGAGLPSEPGIPRRVAYYSANRAARGG